MLNPAGQHSPQLACTHDDSPCLTLAVPCSDRLFNAYPFGTGSGPLPSYEAEKVHYRQPRSSVRRVRFLRRRPFTNFSPTLRSSESHTMHARTSSFHPRLSQCRTDPFILIATPVPSNAFQCNPSIHRVPHYIRQRPAAPDTQCAAQIRISIYRFTHIHYLASDDPDLMTRSGWHIAAPTFVHSAPPNCECLPMVPPCTPHP